MFLGRISQRILFNPRQVLASTVITNGSKNTKKALTKCSMFEQKISSSRRCSSLNAAALSPASNANLDWMKNCTGRDEEYLTGQRNETWWTGKKPFKWVQVNDGISKGQGKIAEYEQITSLPQLNLQNVTKEKLKAYFDNSWLLTEVLFSGLQGEEAFYRPPYHHLRHPMIFYYGHPTSFYVNKLRVAKLIPNGINDFFEEIFEVGVDEMRWDDISTISKDWPAVSEVTAYRKHVYNLVSQVIEKQFENVKTITITWDHPLWALMMGIEHEKIHLETSSVLMRELPLRLLRRPEGLMPLHQSFDRRTLSRQEASFPKNELVAVTGKTVKIGKDLNVPSFGWDNEYGYREIDVPDFQTAKFKVSNGEFFDFVVDKGYQTEKYWSKDGWSWRKFRNAKWPFFWQQNGPAGSHEYKLRTIFEEIPMQWKWPVLVNYHEATAFCNWKNQRMGFGDANKVRLLTEAEHQVLRLDNGLFNTVESDETLLHGGKTKIRNSDMNSSSESDVNFYKLQSAKVHDLFGNVWEWLEDDFNPLEGFQIHSYYDDFSSPCFDGEHKMIMGGSFMSCGDAGSNAFCRYHFRPHFLQHSGFRYVIPSKNEPNIKGEGIAVFLNEGSEFSADVKRKGSNGKNVPVENDYESELLMNQYLALHYGQEPAVANLTVRPHANRPDHALNFPVRSANLLISLSEQKRKALDLGCAVGGSSFKLAETFDYVLGIDFSHSFVHKCQEIANHDKKTIEFFVDADFQSVRKVTASLPKLEFRHRTEFFQYDATNLKQLAERKGKFDAILAANLLCRVQDPLKMLEEMKYIVNKGATVLFLSPHSWKTDFTKREKWMTAEEVETTMKNNGFTKIHDEDVPFIIREHERKYQYVISHAAAFRYIN